MTGKQVMLTGSAEDEDAAGKLRDKFQQLVCGGDCGCGRVWTADASQLRSLGVLLPAVGAACRWLSQDEYAVGLEVDPRTEAAVDPVEDGLQPRRVLA